MGNVTLTLEEFKAHETKVGELEQKIVKLERDLVEVKTADQGKLVELVRSLIVPMRFAIENLTPEVTANWPTAALRAIALLLPNMPDFSSDDQTLVIEIVGFADEADRFARERLRKRAALNAEAISGR